VLLHAGAGRRDLAGALLELLLDLSDEIRTELCLEQLTACRETCNEAPSGGDSTDRERCLRDCDTVAGLCRDFTDPAYWCNLDLFYTELLSITIETPLLRAVGAIRDAHVLGLDDLQPQVLGGTQVVHAAPGDLVLLRIEEGQAGDAWQLFIGSAVDHSRVDAGELGVDGASVTAGDLLDRRGSADLALLVPRAGAMDELVLQALVRRPQTASTSLASPSTIIRVLIERQ
jgi:hypothetical protein